MRRQLQRAVEQQNDIQSICLGIDVQTTKRTLWPLKIACDWLKAYCLARRTPRVFLPASTCKAAHVAIRLLKTHLLKKIYIPEKSCNRYHFGFILLWNWTIYSSRRWLRITTSIWSNPFSWTSLTSCLRNSSMIFNRSSSFFLFLFTWIIHLSLWRD